jgi:hypothetical protein
MHLLAERFIFEGDDRGFLRVSQGLLKGTNVAIFFSVFTSIVYGVLREGLRGNKKIQVSGGFLWDESNVKKLTRVTG